MSQITPGETELFFSENHDTLRDHKVINVKELITDLPIGLNTVAKKNYLHAFGENITKQQYLKFLKNMTHGGDYISFDYLIKHYKLQINPDTQMIQLNDKLSYKNICEEALYLWWLFRIIKQDPFIGQYFNQEHLSIIRQSKIESNILPSNSNFKFDFGLVNLNILLEVNEYAHEQPDAIIEDKIKNDLALLCGYTCITLRVRDVFNMEETDYKKLSDIEIHNILSTSPYLQTFAKKFIYKVTSALLQFADVRNDCIMVLFKQMLKSRIQDIKINIAENNNQKNLLDSQYTNNNNKNTIIEYKDCVSILKLDCEQLEVMTSTLCGLSNSQSFIYLFNIKHLCIISDIPNIITFSNIVQILGINACDINVFKIFLSRCISRTKNLTINNILVTWEELSEIITNYKNESALSIMLEIYYREVGRSYEIIIKMLKSHTDSLKTNKIILTNYFNYANLQLLNINQTLREKNKKTTSDCNKKIKNLNITISKLKEELHNVTKFNSTKSFSITNTVIENILPHNIVISESDYMINAVKEFDRLSLHSPIQSQIQNHTTIETDDDTTASELDSDSNCD